MGLLAGVKRGLKGFHASPHKFERFDLSKVGTGEGSQAFAHGIYLADDADTIEWYKQLFERRGQDAHRYEVDLGADMSALADWDKPIADQPRAIQEAFAELYAMPRKQLLGGQKPQPKGPDESARLLDMGVPGIVFDAGSYWGGKPGARNYVMFDDKRLEILRRYGIALPGGGLLAKYRDQEEVGS